MIVHLTWTTPINMERQKYHNKQKKPRSLNGPIYIPKSTPFIFTPKPTPPFKYRPESKDLPPIFPIDYPTSEEQTRIKNMNQDLSKIKGGINELIKLKTDGEQIIDQWRRYFEWPRLPMDPNAQKRYNHDIQSYKSCSANLDMVLKQRDSLEEMISAETKAQVNRMLPENLKHLLACMSLVFPSHPPYIITEMVTWIEKICNHIKTNQYVSITTIRHEIDDMMGPEYLKMIYVIVYIWNNNRCFGKLNRHGANECIQREAGLNLLYNWSDHFKQIQENTVLLPSGKRKLIHDVIPADYTV